MKTKKPILRLAVLAALSFFTGNEVVAQTTLGAACGCPNYATRLANGTPNVTSAVIANAGGSGTPQWAVIPNAYGRELQNGNITLTCDKIWTIDEKLYIGAGSTITIEPGTLIRSSVINNVGGQTVTGETVANARALIIERGGKIMAAGTQDCPIVFTAAADNLNGSLNMSNKGLWGGILICGKAYNNLKLAANGPFIPNGAGKIAAGDGLGVLEGFASSIPQDQFGVLTAAVANTTSANALSGNFNMFFNSVTPSGATTANTAGQKHISIASSSIGNLNIFVGQPVFAGEMALGTIAEISTSSTGYSSTNPRITMSANLTQAQADSIVANAAGEIKFVGTYPSILTANQPYSFNTLTISPMPFASGTGPFVQVSGSTYVNMASPYFGGNFDPQNSTFQNDDNSGVLSYVSIRHAGANLVVGSEINGLTLASVGRGTKIDHIEIVSCADDNIEIFGGTVNLKYCTTLFGNDDMYDYDLGWSGKAQFLFGMKSNEATVSADNDNGFECDGGDNSAVETATSVNVFASNPQIYNATIIGNAKTTGTADNRGLAAINMKEGSKGTINNSVFANFKNGLNLENGALSSNASHNAYHNWTVSGTQNAVAGGALSAKVKCNNFINIPAVTGGGVATLNASTINGTTTSALSTTELAQFNDDDKNDVFTAAEALTLGFDYSFVVNSTTYAVTTRQDVVPNASTVAGVGSFLLGTGCPQAPVDNFFEPANYRGAFKPGVSNDNWLSDWTYSQVLKAQKGLNPCLGDLNNDGNVNVTDFNLFAPAFGTACN